MINKIFPCIIIYLIASLNFAQVIYVDAAATGGSNNGTSWTNAFVYLQDALDIAVSGNEIWVAEGTYYPDEDFNGDHSNNDPTETFQMIEGVGIYGGFPTGGGTRDISTCETILNGDLDKNTAKNTTDAHHVVVGANNALIDGFTITAGYASEYFTSNDDYFGGGMFNSNTSPNVNECLFTYNRAVLGGGGVYNKDASPTITNCTFSFNQADGISSGSGGGMLNSGNSAPSISNCIFVNNEAKIHGGGIQHQSNLAMTVSYCTFSENTSLADGGGINNSGGNSLFSSCTFSDNQGRDGGAVVTYASNPTFTNCVFLNNTSTGTIGGGGYYAYATSPQLVHCTFFGNTASSAADGLLKSEANVTITNSIFWGSNSQIVNWGTGILTVTYSDIQQATGIYPGTGNINGDPGFLSATDLHLTSASNCLGVATDLGITEDRDGSLRPNPVGTDPDMGAYEYAPIILPNLKVFLEGPYVSGQMNTTLNADLPKTQPFDSPPWNYVGQEAVVNMPQNVVDWLLVELRNGSQANSKVAQKAVFLLSDGSVVELDGTSSVFFDDVDAGDYYVVVTQKNHLNIMSSTKVRVE